MEFVRIYRLRGKVADFTDLSTSDDLIRVQFLDPVSHIDMPKEKWELFVNELEEAINTFKEQDDQTETTWTEIVDNTDKE